MPAEQSTESDLAGARRRVTRGVILILVIFLLLMCVGQIATLNFGSRKIPAVVSQFEADYSPWTQKVAYAAVDPKILEEARRDGDYGGQASSPGVFWLEPNRGDISLPAPEPLPTLTEVVAGLETPLPTPALTETPFPTETALPTDTALSTETALPTETTAPPLPTATDVPTTSGTPTVTHTPTLTRTNSRTPTVTRTHTNTRTFTPTGPTPTRTATLAVTLPPTATATRTPTAVPPSATPTRTNTPLPAFTVTFTNTPLPTATPTVTPTVTPVPTNTFTPSITATPSVTPTGTILPTNTPTPTATATATPTFSVTPTDTDTPTPTFTSSVTPTPTDTATPTVTPTATDTDTPTPTFTPSVTLTPTDTATPTLTPTPSDTPTPTDTATATFTPTPSDTPTPTDTATATFTPTPSDTPTPTDTTTATFTSTPSDTPTLTDTATPTLTPTPTNTPDPCTYVVTNTNDSGLGSLRQALLNANACPGANTITFSISGGGPHTIQPLSALPTITDTVTIDGWSEPDFVSTPVIVLDGNNLTADALVLAATADGSLIRGLVIRDFDGDGITIQSGSDNNTIAGNYIGSLTTAGGAAGVAERNNNAGIHVQGANNLIGGLIAADRNVISGNWDQGIHLYFASGNLIQGNFIGTNAAGTAAIANFQEGIYVEESPANTIGGPSATARNIISGNIIGGITVIGFGSANNIVQGNYIGVNAIGTVAVSNWLEGVTIDGAANTQVGGLTAGAGNVIGGSGQEGIWIINGATGSVIQGNWIGTDKSGTINLGNANAGIRIGNTFGVPANNNLIGGAVPGAGNVIAFNTEAGVAVDTNLGPSVNNAILGNSIYENTGIGIDLDDFYSTPASAGVTPNDGAGDPDSGGNNRQNFPVLTSATTSGSTLTLNGALTSTASTAFRLEFFANVTADPSGYGEGQRYLGYYTATTDAGGVANFSTVLTATVATTETVSATATDPNGNTSEFSAVITPTLPLVVNNIGDAIDSNIGNGVCATAGGVCTLRAAIQEANALAGANTIWFNIAGAGPHTITPGSALPVITGTVMIDGRSEPDFAGTPVVRLDGLSAGVSVDGLSFDSTSDGSTLRSLMITRFSRNGILVASGADGLTIAGNWVGTSGSGSTGVGNGDDGIDLLGSLAVIGGLGANDGNVITNNGDEGLNIAGSGVTGHLIQGNIIGLDPDGSTGNGNTDVGIAIFSGSGNTVGGASVAARNLVSMNYEGIEINTANNTLQGNYVGTDVTGLLNRGNRSDDGVEVQSNATGNLIGGTAPGAGNLIAFNALNGVNVVNGAGNAVLGNAIHSNSLLGINLNTNGVTTNDGAVGGGANNGMDYPIFTSAVISGTTLTVSGYIGTAPGDTDFANSRVEIFESDNDPSGYGEGLTYLGAVTTTTTGDFSGSLTVSGVVVGDGVTGTATDASNNTSEFGPNFTVVAPLVVNNTGDAVDSNIGNGVCATAGGVCTLRAAIQEANALAGANAIWFNIAGAGPHTIMPGSALPIISGPVTIDGFSQTGAAPNTLAVGSNAVYKIILDGISAGTATVGLNVASGNSTITGLVIVRFSEAGVYLNSSGNTVRGNFIGVDVSGTAAAGNGRGTLWDNVTLETGANNNVIGGATPAERNVISAAGGGAGIWLVASNNNTIAGNYIGTNAAGSAALGNADKGIHVEAGTGNVINNNVISGNANEGIRLQTSGASNTTIQGNIIGLDASGANALGNGANGVSVSGGSGTVIGGTTTAARNLISGNGADGINLSGGTSTLIQGNFIGVDVTGALARGNTDAGVYIGSTSGHTIGGTVNGAGNLIAYNADGVVIVEGGTAANQNRIQRNSIYANTDLGIDLGNNGVTANDGAKTAGQPNLLMDYPVFTSAIISGTTLTVSGYIGTAPGDTDFANSRVEIFESDNDPSGYGEGLTYLGALTTTTTGDFSGSLTVSGVVVGDGVTGTATDTGNNTSEFGPNFMVTYPFVTGEPALSANCVQVDYASGTISWASTGNAYRSDDVYASVSVDGTTSEYLYCRNFGFALPVGATIQGVVVDIERKSSSTNNGGSRDASVRLVNATGTPVGNEGATATLYTTGDVIEAHGGWNNLWGGAWTPVEINDVDFGVVLAVIKPNGAGAAHSITVDHVRITIYYLP